MSHFTPSTAANWQRWTAADDALLTARYATATRAELLGLLPSRTWGALQFRASKLGFTRLAYWTPAEDALIRRLYPSAPMAAIRVDGTRRRGRHDRRGDRCGDLGADVMAGFSGGLARS